MSNQLTDQECIVLLKENDTPRHIFLHSRKVAAVALLIATKLKENDIDNNIELVKKAALLHDVKKYYSTKNRSLKHTVEGANYLKELGYEKIGEVIGKHGMGSNDIELLNTWEEKIVNYADKRAQHDKIVSVKERIDDLSLRYEPIYPGTAKRNEEIKLKIFKLENEIFDKIDINPEDITEDTIKEYLIEDDY